MVIIPRAAKSSQQRHHSHPGARHCPPPLTTSRIVATVAAAWGVAPADLVGPSRSRGLVQARQVVVHLTRTLLGVSWAEAAAAVGRADHTTAMHAARRLSAALPTDDRLLQRIDWVTTALAARPEPPPGRPVGTQHRHECRGDASGFPEAHSDEQAALTRSAGP